MNAFLIGLQFLTRIKLVNQKSWTDKEFGSSVMYFPIVGIVIGLILQLLYWCSAPFFSSLFIAILLSIGSFTITGGLHADGLMDTCDGYFSGRNRERILEIMKDSRVGANGVAVFIFIVLFKISLFMELSSYQYLAIMAMPTIARWMMTIGIVRFPYARPQGIGKAFADYAPKRSVEISTAFAILPVVWFGVPYLVLMFSGLIWGCWANSCLVRKLGGLTGDTYGAVAEITEVIVLISLVVLERVLAWNM